MRVIHGSARPVRDRRAYQPLPSHPAITFRELRGLTIPGSGGRIGSPFDLARQLRSFALCYFDNGYVLQDVLCLSAGRLSEVPIISGHHAVIKFGGLHDLAWEMIGKRLLRRFAAVHVLNESDARYAGRLVAGKIFSIPMPVDLELFTPRSKGEQFSVVFVGRLHRQKGVDRLIDVIRLANARFASRVRFVVVGDGPMRRDLCAVEKLQNVRVVGALSRGEVAGAIASSHALIMPSRWESFGLVGAEALACGVPLITSGMGATKEMAQEGRGFVIEDCDEPTEWCDAIAALCNESEIAAAVRLARLRAYAEKNFSLDTVSRQFDRLLESVLTR